MRGGRVRDCSVKPGASAGTMRWQGEDLERKARAAGNAHIHTIKHGLYNIKLGGQPVFTVPPPFILYIPLSAVFTIKLDIIVVY